MNYKGFQPAEHEKEKPTKHASYILLTAVATSIDALGFATFTIVATGVMLGRVLGLMFGKCSEIVGGLMLIAIGSYIFLWTLKLMS